MGGVGGGRMKGGFGRGGGRGGGGGGGGGGGSTNYSEMYESTTGHCVHMRGLPFAATEQDILEVRSCSITVCQRRLFVTATWNHCYFSQCVFSFFRR